MKYNNPPIGCYFDGCAGQSYNDMRVIELALQYGWDDTEAKLLTTVDEDDLTEDQQDSLSDIVADAESYLNELETRPFLCWHWHDGDFGLYPSVENAKEDCGFVSSKTQDYPPDDYVGEWLHVSDHGNCTLYYRCACGADKEIWSCV